MSLLRYTPFLRNDLQQQLNRLFDQFDNDLFGQSEELGGGMFAPPMDVKEDADAYTVHLEVPGVAQEDLNLTLQENMLTIRGQKERRQEAGQGQFRRIERSYGSFARTISLPRSVDGNGVTAHLQDGVLEVRLPKVAEAKPRQINVGVTATTPALSEASETASSGTKSDETKSDETKSDAGAAHQAS